MEMLKTVNDPTQYYRCLKTKMETELLLSAIRLDIFTSLSTPSTLKELAECTGYDNRNLDLFLQALVCAGLLSREGELYGNTPEGSEFLSRTSPLYLGDTILFRDKLNSLEGIDEKIRKGSRALQASADTSDYEFAGLARVAIPEMYLGRVQSFLNALKEVIDDVSPLRLLDLGGGSGIMAIEFVKAFPGASAVVFEHPSVAAVARQTAEQHGVSEKVSAVEGDFNADCIGEGFDVLVASGILDFAQDNLEELLRKMHSALNPRGLLYLVRRKSDQEGLLGWLPGLLNGRNALLAVESLKTSILKSGFELLRGDDAGRFCGEFYRKK